jgi:hypothetical protein
MKRRFETTHKIRQSVKISNGSSVGALTLVNKSLEDWGVYLGAPAKRIKTRKTTSSWLNPKTCALINRGNFDANWFGSSPENLALIKKIQSNE